MINLGPLTAESNVPYREPSPKERLVLDKNLAERKELPDWHDDPTEDEIKLFDSAMASYISSERCKNTGERAYFAIHQADHVVALRRWLLGRR